MSKVTERGLNFTSFCEAGWTNLSPARVLAGMGGWQTRFAVEETQEWPELVGGGVEKVLTTM